MKLLIPFALGWLTCLAYGQEPPCRPVEDDRIYGKDLAAAVPEFSRIPPGTLLANAPQPGSRRTLRVPELQSLALRYAVDFETPHEICFEWAMEPMDRNLVLEAMRRSLLTPDAEIEIAETSLYPVPRGLLEFARERLGTPASPAQRDPILWRGDVIYGGGHRYAVWARVRIKVRCERLVAVGNLRTGYPIAAEQLRLDTGVCFPGSGQPPPSKDQIVGMLPIRPIAAGSEIRSALLSSPYDVIRGDLVEVEVRSGAARVQFTGRAESAGHLGDSIAIRNPASNKIFQARVNGRNRALVQTDRAEEK